MEVEELEAAALQDTEEEELFAEYNIMANSEELSRSIGILANTLNGERKSIIPALMQHSTTWSLLEQLDSTLEELHKAYKSATIELQELEYSLRNYKSSLNYNPVRYQQVGDRLSEINKLKKKYGQTIPEILEYLATAQQKLCDLQYADERIGDLETALTEAHEATDTAAATLTAARKKAAIAIGKEATQALHQLNMPKAQLEVRITAQTRNSHGDDIVTFFIAPNVGEKMVALKECASGGELSRVQLALKTLLAGKEATPTLVFDEVDANIGGTTATVVGQQLKKIGTRHQVLCITHFPQVAQQADHHIVISKAERDRRTLTEIHALSEKERKTEIGRMQGVNL
jgi:DNA repair protein RecN (Recombination protein N)